MADLLNKKNSSKEKNSLEQKTTPIEPEQAFNRQRLFTGTEEKKTNQQTKLTTGTRIEVDVLNDLKALKAIDKSDSISEVIQTLLFTREKSMSKDEKREYDLIRKIMK